MFLRQLRWSIASVAVVAAICLAPAQSKAEVQILVEELNAGGGVVGSGTYSVGSPSGTTTFSQTFTHLTPGGFFEVDGFTTTNSHRPGFNASLSTSFNVGITDAFVASQNHSLRITVTDDRFASNGQPVTLNNGVAIPLGLEGAVIESTAFSRIYDPLPPSTITQASSTTQLAGYLVASPTTPAPNLALTDPAVDERPRLDPDQSNTSATASSLPSPYAIQQEILVFVTGPDSLRGSTFTVNASARITSTQAAAIPAPGGLALALIALPLLGLRRTLRKRAAV